MLSIWNKASNIGIDIEMSREQKAEVRLLNQVVLILVIVLGLKFIFDLIDRDYTGMLVGFSIFLLFSLSFLFQFCKKFFLTKCYFAFIFIFCVTTVTTLLGRQLGGEFLFFTASILTLVLFYNTRVIYIFFLLIILGYTFCQWYQYHFESPLAHIVASSSFHFMAISSSVCSTLIAMNFIKQNQIVSKESLKLLGELKEKNNKLETSQIQIQDQNNELERANMELERFAFIASHDLKTPLRSVSTFNQLINQRLRSIGINDKKVFEYLGYVVKSTKHMYSLIEDILEYSGIRKGEFKHETVNLNELVNTTLINLHELIKETNTNIHVSTLPTIQGNETSLILLIQNLIENSIKYNESDSPIIKIESEQSEEEYILHFSDNGIGIDPAYFKKVFNMFERLHTQDTYSGSGIGLAFCQRVTEMHGGHIEISSSSKNGSTFSVHLPKDEKAQISNQLSQHQSYLN